MPAAIYGSQSHHCGVATTRNSKSFAVRAYDLDATLASGQAFRWYHEEGSWVGVIGEHWVRLRSDRFFITAETAVPVQNWSWLVDYLQLELDLETVLLSFPTDEPMCAAVSACRGLRLLRQEPWECLASFILSSTKQIVQIQQIINCLCERYGDLVPTGAGAGPAYVFPTAARLARTTEAELRACKMGFRAPYLLATARAIAGREFELDRIAGLSLDLARIELMHLPGVGPKIADCVLLFAYGFQTAFPVDVWVRKALRQLYFPRRRVLPKRLQEFSATHFGAYAGYAQQYLFHYMRTQRKAPQAASRTRKGKAAPNLSQ